MQTTIQKAIEDIKGYKAFGKTIDIDFVIILLNSHFKEEKQNMKQTSIEWLIEQMLMKGYFDKNVTFTNIDHLQHEAKEMHKQEIIDAAERWKGTDFAERYYEETFGSKGASHRDNPRGDETLKDYHIVDANEMVENKSLITNIDYWEKTLKYWKEEKELAILGSTYYSNCCARIGILEDIFKCIEPIQKLPQQEISDEEIEKWVASTPYYGHCTTEYREGLEEGAKWYREQLKSKQ